MLQQRSGDVEGSFDETVVDRAMAWLGAQAAESPLLAAVEEQAMLEADAHVQAWSARQEKLAKRSRKARGSHRNPRPN